MVIQNMVKPVAFLSLKCEIYINLSWWFCPLALKPLAHTGKGRKQREKMEKRRKSGENNESRGKEIKLRKRNTAGEKKEIGRIERKLMARKRAEKKKESRERERKQRKKVPQLE